MLWSCLIFVDLYGRKALSDSYCCCFIDLHASESLRSMICCVNHLDPFLVVHCIPPGYCRSCLSQSFTLYSWRAAVRSFKGSVWNTPMVSLTPVDLSMWLKKRVKKQTLRYHQLLAIMFMAQFMAHHQHSPAIGWFIALLANLRFSCSEVVPSIDSKNWSQLW